MQGGSTTLSVSLDGRVWELPPGSSPNLAVRAAEYTIEGCQALSKWLTFCLGVDRYRSSNGQSCPTPAFGSRPFAIRAVMLISERMTCWSTWQLWNTDIALCHKRAAGWKTTGRLSELLFTVYVSLQFFDQIFNRLDYCTIGIPRMHYPWQCIYHSRQHRYRAIRSRPPVSTSTDDHDSRTKLILRVLFAVMMTAQLVDDESASIGK